MQCVDSLPASRSYNDFLYIDDFSVRRGIPGKIIAFISN